MTTEPNRTPRTHVPNVDYINPRRIPKTVDIRDIEDELSRGLQQLAETRLPPQPQPVAPIVDISKLSADAVLEQYKMAAKSVEDMGEEIQKRIRALEAALKECDDDMKLLKEAAAAIMEKGKHAHAEIERTATVSKDIREIVAQVKGKLA